MADKMALNEHMGRILIDKMFDLIMILTSYWGFTKS